MAPRARERGIALLMALLVLTLLVLLVTQMVLTASHNRSVADNATADLRTSYGVKAGYHQARLFLDADSERDKDVDSVNEPWFQPIEVRLGMPEMPVRIAITDSASRINLTAMVDNKGEIVQAAYDRFTRLLAQWNHPGDIAVRILDYQDADTRGDFEAGARNERLDSLDELERIEGIDRDVLYGRGNKPALLSFLTCWPRDPMQIPKGPQGTESTPNKPASSLTKTPTGQASSGGSLVNINTAGVEVLQTLDADLTLQMAEAIVNHRSERDEEGQLQNFKQASDLAKVDGLDPAVAQRITAQVTVKAPAFEIRVTAVSGAVEKRWLYVVKRAPAPPSQAPPGQQAAPKPPILQLIHQQRESEERSLKRLDEKEE